MPVIAGRDESYEYTASRQRGRLITETVAVGRRTLVSVEGELDIDTTPDLGEAARAALDAGAYELWIDLSAVAFADSSAVHCLFEIQDRARASRRRLAIICPGGAVRRTFVLAGADALLPLFASRHQAHRHS